MMVREGVEVKRAPPQGHSPRASADPIYNGRSGSKSFGLPPPQLRSVHLRSGLLPTPQPVEDDVEESVGFASEYEETTDSGEERDSGRYSGDSSPQEDPLLRRHYRGLEPSYNSNGGTRRSMPPVQRRETYTGDYLYSHDRPPLHSQRQYFSGNVPEGRYSRHQEELVTGDPRYSHSRRQEQYADDESSETAESSDGTGVHPTRNSNGNYGVEHSSSSIPSVEDFIENTEEEPATYTSKNGRNGLKRRPPEPELQQQQFPMPDLRTSGPWPRNLSDMEMPSAPPMAGSFTESTETGNQNTPYFPPRSSARPDIVEAEIKSRTQQGTPSYAAFDLGMDRQHRSADKPTDQCTRPASMIGGEAAGPSCRQATGSASHTPTFHLSGQGAWQALISYDACVRLCLRAWARGCMEAPEFLHNECTLLRSAFGLQQILLQPEEELLRKGSTDAAPEGSAPKPKKTVGKIKVQVRKVKIMLDMPSGCSFRSFGSSLVDFESLRSRSSNFRSTLMSGWEAVRNIRVMPRAPLRATYSQRSVAYMQASAQYIRQVSSLLKAGVSTLRSNTLNETLQGHNHISCYVAALSSIVEVQDSKGNVQGRVLVQLASISDDPADKLRWWSIYREPEHESVGKVQLFINYITTTDDLSSMKPTFSPIDSCCVILDIQFPVECNNLYLSSIMDVATPTEDCLVLVHDLLVPVVKARDENTLSRQEVRWTGVTTQHSTAPFVEDMYERIKDTLNEYEIIVCRWPEYTFALENAIADVEKAVVEALEKQYADVLAPLKDSMVPKKFGLQYVQKLAKRRSVSLYSVPNQLGVFLNTIKRLLDVLRPKIEAQLKSWVSCLPEGAGGNMVFGERLSEITVMLRAKFKNFLQAIVEKLADNVAGDFFGNILPTPGVGYKK